MDVHRSLPIAVFHVRVDAASHPCTESWEGRPRKQQGMQPVPRGTERVSFYPTLFSFIRRGAVGASSLVVGFISGHNRTLCSVLLPTCWPLAAYLPIYLRAQPAHKHENKKTRSDVGALLASDSLPVQSWLYVISVRSESQSVASQPQRSGKRFVS